MFVALMDDGWRWVTMGDDGMTMGWRWDDDGMTMGWRDGSPVTVREHHVSDKASNKSSTLTKFNKHDVELRLLHVIT